MLCGYSVQQITIYNSNGKILFRFVWIHFFLIKTDGQNMRWGLFVCPKGGDILKLDTTKDFVNRFIEHQLKSIDIWCTIYNGMKDINHRLAAARLEYSSIYAAIQCWHGKKCNDVEDNVWFSCWQLQWPLLMKFP